MKSTNRVLRPFAVVLATGLLAALLVPIAARSLRADQKTLALAPGDSVTLTCGTALKGQMQESQATVACPSLQKTSLPTPANGPMITDLKGIQEGQVVSGTVKIEALVAGEQIARVTFELSGPKSASNTEKARPYAFFGDRDGQLIGWDTTQFPDGDYTLKATVTDAAGRSNVREVHFQVANNGQPPAPVPSATAVAATPTAAAASPTPVGNEPQATPAPPAADQPAIYLSAAEIAAIKAQVQAGRQPWKAAYDRMLADANRALSAGRYSVTSDGGPQGGHEYFTQQPYCGWKKVDGKDPDCRDGKVNPRANRKDYEAAIAVSRAVRDLGLGYAFTGDAKYADRALQLMRTWAIDPQTRLNPAFTNGQSRIELSVTMPALFYGASLISSYPGWSTDDRHAFEQWVGAFAGSAQQWQSKANFENWRINFLAATGAFLHDRAILDAAFNGYRQNFTTQVDAQGRMVKELGRANSLSYSLYAINAMVQTAEIARQWGVDLYGYTVDGKGLKTVLDYYAPYAAGQQRWPDQQIKPLTANDNVALYELAYSHWQEPAYKAVIDRWGRPMYESRILGPVTLTHGDLFALK